MEYFTSDAAKRGSRFRNGFEHIEYKMKNGHHLYQMNDDLAYDFEPLVNEIRAQIEDACRAEGTPYVVSVGIGWDALRDGEDTLQMCMQGADEKLYLDKARGKRQGFAARAAY